MRKCTIALLRIPNPRLYSHASLSRGPPPFLSFCTSLPSAPEAGEVGAWMGALETREQAKAGELNTDKIHRGSLHAEIPTSLAEGKAKNRPTSAKAKRKAKENVAGVKTDIAVVNAEDVIAREEETTAQNAATGKAQDPALHVFEEEKALQDAATDRAEDVPFNAAANENMIKAKEELSEWVTRIDLSTFKCGQRWEETAYKLLDFGISSAHVMKMLPKCRALRCGRSPDPTLKHFTVLGMSHELMGRTISRFPYILNMSNNLFQSKVEFFESVGVDKQTLGRIMHVGYRNMSLSLSTLKGRSDFWKEYFQDVQENALGTLISANPTILTRTLKNGVKPKLDYFVEELGFNKKILITHAGLVCDSLKLHARLHNLLALGFSFKQVQKLIAASPHLLVFNEDGIKLRLSYAVNVMNLSLDTLAACPVFWRCNYEKRIKYRYEVLQELKALGAYKKNISLGYLVKMTDIIFSRRFVSRLQACTKHSNSYNQTCKTNGAGVAKKKRHILKV